MGMRQSLTTPPSPSSSPSPSSLPIFLATLTSRRRRAVFSSPIRVVVCRQKMIRNVAKKAIFKGKESVAKRAEKVILRNVAMLQACNALRVVEQTCEIFCKTYLWSLEQNISDLCCKTVTVVLQMVTDHKNCCSMDVRVKKGHWWC